MGDQASGGLLEASGGPREASGAREKDQASAVPQASEIEEGGASTLLSVEGGVAIETCRGAPGGAGGDEGGLKGPAVPSGVEGGLKPSEAGGARPREGLGEGSGGLQVVVCLSYHPNS